jgi:anti-anti-sigma factor
MRGDRRDTQEADFAGLEEWSLAVSQTDGRAVVEVTGEFDMARYDEFDSLLRDVEAREPGVIVADLRKVSFLDSSGMRALLAVYRRSQENGRRFALVLPPEPVAMPLRIAGLDTVFTVVDDPGIPGSV